ncbi:MAG TPA: hypothetical protein VEI97_06650 [bacterium]|nr:hypothetical protein [bacterium]
MDTPSPPRRRWKRWMLVALIGLPLLAILAFPLIVKARQQDLVEWVRVQSGGEMVPTRVEGSLNGGLVLLDTTLYAVHGLPQPVPVAHVQKARGQVDMTALRKHRKFWLTTIEVYGFTLDLRLDEDNDLIWPEFDWDGDPGRESAGGPEPPKDPKSWPAVDREPRTMDIALNDGTVRYHLPELIAAGKPPITVEQVTTAGRYTEKRQLEVSRFEGTLLDAPLRAQGTFLYRRDRPYTIDVDLGAVSLPDLLNLLLEDPSGITPAGKAALTGTYSGLRGRYKVEGRLTAEELRFQEVPITAADLTLVYEGGKDKDSRITVAEGTVSSYGSTAQVTGWATLQGKGVQEQLGHLEAVVKDLALGDYLRKRGLPSYGLDGGFDGRLTFDSRGADRWDASVDLLSTSGTVVSPFSPDLRAIVAGTQPAEPEDRMRYSRLELRAQAAPKRLNLDELTLISPDFTMAAAGQIADPGPVDLAGRIRARKSKAKELEEYGKYVAFLPDEDGFVTYEFTVTGTTQETQFNPKIQKNASAGLKDRVSDIGREISDAWKKIF